jgi:hypothetical protein
MMRTVLLDKGASRHGEILVGKEALQAISVVAVGMPRRQLLRGFGVGCGRRVVGLPSLGEERRQGGDRRSAHLAFAASFLVRSRRKLI